MDQFQFYPTPPALAEKMIAKFTGDIFDRDARILDPFAGDGALTKALVELHKTRHADALRKHHGYWERPALKVDFIEIDFGKHPILKAIDGIEGDVIGLDFVQFSGSLAAYNFALLNPPYNRGVSHVLKLWEGMFDGEIVAQLNAESIKNPYSKERQRLVRLIEQHGDVEFVEGAYRGADVQREAEVEVAIVHLTKKADVQHDIVGDVLSTLRVDDQQETGGAGAFASQVNGQDLALPGDVIVMTERAFKAAVAAMRDAVMANARAGYLSRLVGKTMAQRSAEAMEDNPENLTESIRTGIVNGYAELKDRAWSEVLRSSNFSSRLSSHAQRRLEAEFETIKKLDFSAANVYAFLIGLIQSQGDMNLQMACDCFDQIGAYHEENTVWYMGWKSNGKHRTAGRRIKMTRFILPRFTAWTSNSLGYEEMQRLKDFDKVFAVLDGKLLDQTFGLADLFKRDAARLAHGERLSCDYFDVRWYPGAGTVHFFPKRKDMIDRLNRIVGRARQWLPERDEMVSKDFWLAYDQAEKFQAAVDREMEPSSSFGRSVYWTAARTQVSEHDREEVDAAMGRIAQACLKVAQHHGLDPSRGIESAQQELPLLAMAA